MAIEKKIKREILAILAEVYRDIGPALEYGSPFQLLVATALAAQTTDVQVNKATAGLFRDYPDPQSMAGATPEALIPYIRSLGLYRTKAGNIAALAQMLVADFGGEVPRTREELMGLPGIGRKTANVVLAFAFGIPALAVDTHVFRVSRRMGLANAATPGNVEKQLCLLIPEENWIAAHHWLIWHGRRCCKAQRPDCVICPVKGICPRVGVAPAKTKAMTEPEAATEAIGETIEETIAETKEEV
ncbi:MAG: endonuclease III [Clostridiales bacterium]|nr:endonuclease III [Clostridiales bacterium]